MPLWLLQTSLSPFHFQKGRMMPCVQSLGGCSDTHTWLMMWVRHRIIVSLPTFNISVLMVQLMLQLLSFFRAVLTSAGVTGSSLQLLLVGNMSEVLIGLGLVETGGWSRRRLKCSFQHSRQAVCVVRRFPLESFTRAVLIGGPVWGLWSMLDTCLKLFFAAASMLSASSAQNFSWPSAIALLRIWLSWWYSFIRDI